MIFVSHALPVNEDRQPRLDRAAVWNGLVLKADNALPFVPAMTRCDIVERYGPTVFDRDIEFRGQRFRERITLEEPHRVVFTRISGPVLGTIANEIEGPDDDLRLRFSFALVVAGVEGGSQAEREYADGMTADYRKAVCATSGATSGSSTMATRRSWRSSPTTRPRVARRSPCPASPCSTGTPTARSPPCASTSTWPRSSPRSARSRRVSRPRR